MITITTDVFCDYCGEWTHGTTGPKPQARLSRAIVKDQGWVAYLDPKKGLLDCCPRCREEHKNEV